MPQRRAKSRKKTKNKSTKDESTKKNKMPTRQRRKIREAAKASQVNKGKNDEDNSKSLLEKGISLLQKSKTVVGSVLYCDGVGNYATGIAYKTVATGILAVLYKTFLDFMYDNFMPGGLSKLSTVASYTAKMCTSVVVRSVVPFFNQICNPYVKLVEDATYFFAQINIYVIAVFAAPFVKEGLSELITFSPDKAALGKSVIASAKNVDNLVCYVAEQLYKFVQGKNASCDIKNNKSDSPELIKTLSSELRLFDNSLKF